MTTRAQSEAIGHVSTCDTRTYEHKYNLGDVLKMDNCIRRIQISRF